MSRTVYEVRERSTAAPLLSWGFCLGYAEVGGAGARFATRVEAERVRREAGASRHVVVAISAA